MSIIVGASIAAAAPRHVRVHHASGTRVIPLTAPAFRGSATSIKLTSAEQGFVDNFAASVAPKVGAGTLMLDTATRHAVGAYSLLVIATSRGGACIFLSPTAAGACAPGYSMPLNAVWVGAETKTGTVIAGIAPQAITGVKLATPTRTVTQSTADGAFALDIPEKHCMLRTITTNSATGLMVTQDMFPPSFTC
jgi:hypothetical protein